MVICDRERLLVGLGGIPVVSGETCLFFPSGVDGETPSIGGIPDIIAPFFCTVVVWRIIHNVVARIGRFCNYASI